jgi:prepilin-type N-terminal cleavage/methylation domain-containing protein
MIRGNGTRSRRREQGFTLLESLIACAIFLIGISGIMGMITIASVMNAGQGNLATRSTEYAASKMEQLMALSFTDSVSDTRFLPTATSGGSGLGAGTTASTTYPSGGNLVAPSFTHTGIAVTCADTNYCDYIVQGTNSITVSTGATGTAAPPAGAAYMRQWQIQVDSTGNIKTITVLVTSLQALGSIAPHTTLVSQKNSSY